MKTRVFYSFHYKDDFARAAQIRNIGMIEGNLPASDNDWEKITRGGDKAIKGWIDKQLRRCCCTIVLIGQHTARRKWIDYEIEKSWSEGKGVLGIYIHRLKDLNSEYAVKGRNPFDHIRIQGFIFKRNLSKIVEAYAPPHRDSKRVYKYIRENISEWIDEAISIRNEW